MRNWKFKFFILTACILFAGNSIAQLYSSNQQLNFNNPLINAADAGNGDVVQALLQSGQKADSVGDFGSTALMRAALRGNKGIVEELLKKGANPNIQDEGGATALHFASRQGNDEIVKILLDNGANPNLADNEQWTPLMRAAASKRKEVVKQLLAKNSDVKRKNRIGETALFHAVYGGDSEITRMIMEKGANPNERNVYGNSPINIAEKQENKQIQQLLGVGVKTPVEVAKKEEVKAAKNIWSEASSQKPVPEKTIEVNTEKLEKIKEQKLQEKEIAEDKIIKKIENVENKAKDIRDGKTLIGILPPKDEKKLADNVEEQERIKKLKLEELRKKAEQERPVESKPTIVATKPVQNEAISFYAQLGEFEEDYEIDRKLQQVYAQSPEIFTGKKILVSKGAEKTRLRIGRFVNKDEAVNYCTSLRLKNTACYVVETDREQQEYVFKPDPNFIARKNKITEIDLAANTANQAQPQPQDKIENKPEVELEKKQLQKKEAERKIAATQAAPNIYDSEEVKPEEKKIVAAPAPKEVQKIQKNAALPVQANKSPPINIIERPNVVEKNTNDSSQLAMNNYLRLEDISKNQIRQNQGEPEKFEANSMQNILPGGSNFPNSPAIIVQKPVNDTPWLEAQPVIIKGSTAVAAPLPEKLPVVKEVKTKGPKSREEMDKILIAKKLKLPAAVKQAGKQQPASLSMKNSKAAAASQNNPIKSQPVKVEVAEAIRVPVSSDRVGIKNDLPISAVKKEIAFIPSADKGARWAEISSFATENEAANLYTAILPTIQKPLRLRIIKPLATNEIMMRVGEIDSAEQIKTICDMVKGYNKSCRVVDDSVRENVNKTITVSNQAYWLHLGTFSSRGQAENRWQGILKANADILANMQKSVKQPENSSSDIPVFRLKAGPVYNKFTADNACQKLGTRSIPCFIVLD